MFYCGHYGNAWLEDAISCLPDDVYEGWIDKVAFLSTNASDAFRVSRALRETRELIFISERIIPKRGMNEAHPGVRYFIFAVLHEIVHAVRQHKPPNEITPEENAAQEAEANELAFAWYNDYLRWRNHPDLPQFTREELEIAQALNREAMQENN